MPKSFGNWHVIKQLASRNDSNVYLANYNNSKAAIKVLKGFESSDESVQKRFFQEITNLKSIDHVGVPKILEFDLTDALNPWMAIEYFEGNNLEKTVKSSGPLKASEWFLYFKQVTEILAHVHSKGIYHRDVSPSNIIINQGRAKLIDFGISYVQNNELMSLQGGSPLGTPATQSPESFIAIKNDKMDMFSLASTFVFAASGKFPFDSESSSISNYQKISFEKPNFYDLSKSQIELLTPMFYKEPKDRISSQEMYDVLSKVDGINALDLNSLQGFSKFLTDSQKKLTSERPLLKKKRSRRVGPLLIGVALASWALLYLPNQLNSQSELTSENVRNDVIMEEVTASAEPTYPDPLLTPNSATDQESVLNEEVKKAEKKCQQLVNSSLYKDALKSCQKAAEGGSLIGMHNLGFISSTELKDDQAARYWYEMAGAKGYALSFSNLGIIEKSLNLEKAIGYWEKCFELGEGKCAVSLGNTYEDKGKLNLAIRWFKNGIEKGIGTAGLNLGMIYLKQGKIEEARSAFEFGSKNGDYVAQYNFGLILWDEYAQKKKACKEFKESWSKSDSDFKLPQLAYIENCKNISWKEAEEVINAELPISPYRSVNPDYYPGSWVVNMGTNELNDVTYRYWIQSKVQNSNQNWKYRYYLQINHTNGKNGVVQGDPKLPNECLEFRIVGEKEENVILKIWNLPKSTCKNSVDYYELLRKFVSFAPEIPQNVKSEELGGVPYFYPNTNEWIVPIDKDGGSGAITVGQVHLLSKEDNNRWVRIPFRVLSPQLGRHYISIDSVLVVGLCPSFRIIEIENDEITRLWTKPIPLECDAN